MRKCKKCFLFLGLWNTLKTGVGLLFCNLAPYPNYVRDCMMRICLRARLNNLSIWEIHWHCVVMKNVIRLKGLWQDMTLLLDDWPFRHTCAKWWICLQICELWLISFWVGFPFIFPLTIQFHIRLVITVQATFHFHGEHAVFKYVCSEFCNTLCLIINIK